MSGLSDIFNEDNGILSDRQETVGDSLALKHKNINIFDLPSGLCFSCSFGLTTHRKFGQPGEYNIKCTYSYDKAIDMPPDIDYCSKYSRHGAQTLEDMKKVAIPIEKDQARKAGFETEDSDSDI